MKVRTMDNNAGMAIFNQNGGDSVLGQIIMEPTDAMSILVPKGYKLTLVSTGDDGSTTYAFGEA